MWLLQQGGLVCLGFCITRLTVHSWETVLQLERQPCSCGLVVKVSCDLMQEVFLTLTDFLHAECGSTVSASEADVAGAA